MNSTKLEISKSENEKGFLHKRYLLHILLFIYVIADLIAIHTNLANSVYIKPFIDTIAAVVPSINTIAALTLMPITAAFILSISWVMIIVAILLMLLFVNWDEINFEEFYENVSSWLILLTFISFPVLFLFLMSFTPYNDGVLGKFIYFNLKNSIYFVILYGAGLWLSLSAGLFFLVFNLYYLFNKKRRS